MLTARPTEMPEFDIYICESKYHELEHSIKRLGKGLKVGCHIAIIVLIIVFARSLGNIKDK